MFRATRPRRPTGAALATWTCTHTVRHLLLPPTRLPAFDHTHFENGPSRATVQAEPPQRPRQLLNRLCPTSSVAMVRALTTPCAHGRARQTSEGASSCQTWRAFRWAPSGAAVHVELATSIHRSLECPPGAGDLLEHPDSSRHCAWQHLTQAQSRGSRHDPLRAECESEAGRAARQDTAHGWLDRGAKTRDPVRSPATPPPHPRVTSRSRSRCCMPLSRAMCRALTYLPLCSEAFDLFDTDGSGTIDAKELKVAMRCAP